MEQRRRPEQNRSRQPKAKKRGSVAGKIFGVLGTLLLIGVCT